MRAGEGDRGDRSDHSETGRYRYTLSRLVVPTIAVVAGTSLIVSFLMTGPIAIAVRLVSSSVIILPVVYEVVAAYVRAAREAPLGVLDWAILVLILLSMLVEIIWAVGYLD